MRKISLKSLLPGIVRNPIFLCVSSLQSKIKKTIVSFEITPSDKWLDVGCGLRPYESYFPKGCYIGVDVETSGRNHSRKTPDYFYDGVTLPFPENSFDGVICTEVLEHVPDTLGFLSEMQRVIKPGGGLIISIPFAWQEHEEPYDFFRFTRYGITKLLQKTGFEVDKIVTTGGTIVTLATMLNVYIINNLIAPIGSLGKIMILLLCFPIQLFALLFKTILPDQGKLYLGLVIRARKSKERASR